MREQLIRYIDLLFAGAADAADIKQEILQNTLDRYDDLVAQGKSPEAAYRLAISGIGDINEILGCSTAPAAETGFEKTSVSPAVPAWKKALRAAGVFLYILCPIPLFVLGEIGMDTIGLCGTLSIVAVATALMVIAGGNGKTAEKEDPVNLTPRQELHKAIKTIITTVGLIIYFLLSFSTGAWWITWLVFPIMAAVQGMIKAIVDLKEAVDYEN